MKMLNSGKKAIVLTLALVWIPVQGSAGGMDDFLKTIQKAVGGESAGLSESTIVDGLKEALEIGTGNAVSTVSKPNGYYKNPDIKILLPEKVRKVEGILRGVGYGEKIDAFEQSVNRAAEKAAPEAKAYFVDAIKQMPFDDARKILNGGDNAATLYFEDKTRGKLFDTFKPIVHDNMSEVGVTRYYQDLDSKVRSIPFAGDLSFDLDKYVTDKSLDGLFKMVAEEEAKIRKDPAARVTDLLKKVFRK
jgi:hypothetical protein